MEFITFKQFIYTINVRQYNEDISGDKCDSQIIRLYYKSDSKQWIDIGWYDFSIKDSVWNRLSLFLNENILNSIVTNIQLEVETNEIKVYLEDRKDFEDLDAYAN